MYWPKTMNDTENFTKTLIAPDADKYDRLSYLSFNPSISDFPLVCISPSKRLQGTAVAEKAESLGERSHHIP